MLCGEGNPAHGFLACVKFIHTTFPDVNIKVGGDPIPIGVEIYACYHHANTYQYKYSVDVNMLKWAFLLPRDILEDNGTHQSVIMTEGDFSERDRHALERLQNHPWMASVAQGGAERFGELTLMTNPDKSMK